MALTVARNDVCAATVNAKHAIDQGQIEFGTIAFDSSYPTGGESFTPKLNNIYFIKFSNTAGYVLDYDYDSNLIMVYYADYDAVADGPLIEVADETDLTVLTGVRYMAYGTLI